MLGNKKWVFIAASFVLAACSSGQRNLYHWGNGNYANAVYQSIIQESDPQEHIHNLEQLVQSGHIAPGVYAQLGLLYDQAGNNTKAVEAFQKEAELFPESRSYMQFLLNKGKVVKGKGGAK